MQENRNSNHVLPRLYGLLISMSLLVSSPAIAGGAALASITLSPSSVTGGTPTIATVSLTGPPARPYQRFLRLSSSNSAAATVPAIVFIAGPTHATFMVATKPVALPTFLTIFASYAGMTKTATLTVLPPALTYVTSTTCTGTTQAGLRRPLLISLSGAPESAFMPLIQESGSYPRPLLKLLSRPRGSPPSACGPRFSLDRETKESQS